MIGLTPGPPFHQSPEELRSAIEQVAAIPFEGRVGYEGIAIGSDFLEFDETLPGLGDADSIGSWLSRTFDREAAALLPRPTPGDFSRATAAAPNEPSSGGVQLNIPAPGRSVGCAHPAARSPRPCRSILPKWQTCVGHLPRSAERSRDDELQTDRHSSLFDRAS